MSRARPLFPRHEQPRVPGELGYYDLRDRDIRARQAALARAFGISAFCYWHYWFGGGRRILTEVFDEVLASGEPDFPFCLAWANESWTGTWYGAPDRMLVAQMYPGTPDEEAHFAAVLPAFEDPRYVRIGGRPLFVVLRPRKHPDLRGFVRRWQRMARHAGLEGIFFAGEVHFRPGRRPWPPSSLGLDATIDFGFSHLTSTTVYPNGPRVFDYDAGCAGFPRLHPEGTLSFPCVVPQWDNTPRVGRRGVVVHGAHPEGFGRQVAAAVDLVLRRSADERIIFVRAWNEWGEGNYLEPDRLFGSGFLEAHRENLQ